MVSPLAVSVIIPTFNRAHSLHRILGSLSRQALPLSEFEVIIVDDGSTDLTPGIAAEPRPISIKYHRQENKGSAAARNAGADLATGKVLVFLDDDMIVDPDYLSALQKEHRAHHHTVCMGTEYPCLSEPASIYSRVITADKEEIDNGTQLSAFVDFTACVTNNLSVEREHFYSIGGMHDVAGDGPTWWGDVDFGYRAFQQGMLFRRSGKAKCWHCDYSIADFPTSLARAEKASYLVHYLTHKHPGIITHLPMFDDKLPIAWRSDDPTKIVRKTFRSLTSTELVVDGMKAIVEKLERHYPKPALLRPLYRWISGAYIYRGFRHGLKELSFHESQ